MSRKPSELWIGSQACVNLGLGRYVFIGVRHAIHQLAYVKVTPKDCRRLAAWLLRAAEWIEGKQKKGTTKP